MTQEQAPPAPPAPTAEHRELAELVGTWNVNCTFFMDPSQPPMVLEGKETVEMFGDFWTSHLFEAEMFGQPFKGRSTLGFEPHSNEYVSTWMDTMSPTFFKFTGKFDASGKKLEMGGEAFDCMLHAMTTYRTTEERISKDERVFEMFMTLPDGNEVKMFTHVYTRA